jgi:glycosyltransferase involved in cell wall biosynthesis
MHDTARDIGQRFFETYVELPLAKILEIGSYNVNGTLRDCAPPSAIYVGVDLSPGPGVDIVLEDPHLLPFADEHFDAVVSSSCFEHDPMFWVTFMQVVRVTKTGGFIYINAPSNGSYHTVPFDNWRFYPDAALSLVKWASQNGHQVELLESFIAKRQRDVWNDCVMVFCKGLKSKTGHRRIVDVLPGAYNIRRSATGDVENRQIHTEDMLLLDEAKARFDAREREVARLTSEARSLQARLYHFEECHEASLGFQASPATGRRTVSDHRNAQRLPNPVQPTFKHLRASARQRILIYAQTNRAFGAVHAGLAAQLCAAGWVAELKDWSRQYYLSEFHKEAAQYDYVLTVANEGNRILVHDYGIPPEKIIVVAHDESDLQGMISSEGVDGFDRYRSYGVVSDLLACSSIALGIKRVPVVVRLGVDFSRYRRDIAADLSSVGYAATMLRQTVSGIERKRGPLARACAEAAGLPFVPIDNVPLEKMPDFYGSVGSVVMPSLQEGAGLPPLEGAAAGRLVIGTPVGHFPRLAYEGLGILAPLEAGDFQRFTTETLIYYRDNPTAYVEKCAAIQEAAQQRDWQYVVKDWMEFFCNAR